MDPALLSEMPEQQRGGREIRQSGHEIAGVEAADGKAIEIEEECLHQNERDRDGSRGQCLAQAPPERRRHEHEQEQDKEGARRTIRQERERRNPGEIDAAEPQRQILPLVERVPQRGGDCDTLAGVQRQEGEHQPRLGVRTCTAEPASDQAGRRQESAGNREEPFNPVTLIRGARGRKASDQRGSSHVVTRAGRRGSRTRA
jgi:hypothetical protein